MSSATEEALGSEPRNEQEARSRVDWPLWEEAMKTELIALEETGTWVLVERPSVNIVGSHWVYRLKCDATGKIVKYKARLVAQGFTQALGIDFNETFAPVAKLTSNRIILALAALNDWEVHQVDVKNAYLNADLDEEIYMMQPPGFAAPGREDWVCLLKKALYGLKQAGRQWYACITDTFLRLGYTCCETEHCVFVRWSGSKFTAIVVAVDDLTIVANSVILVEDAK